MGESSQQGGHLPPSLSIKVSLCLSKRSWLTGVRNRFPGMPRPHSTQENRWFADTSLEASPQWGDPCSSVSGGQQGGDLPQCDLSDQTPSEGRWYEQGGTMMQIPTLRNKVSVQKWPHRGTSTNTQPTNLHPTGTAAKYSQSLQWYSSVRHTAKLAPGHFCLLALCLVN